MNLSKTIPLTFLGLLLVRLVISQAQADNPKSAKGVQKADLEGMSIPQAEIYTTSPQPGFKETLRASFLPTNKGENRKPVHPYSFDLHALEARLGPSNIFLVRGEDLATAIAETRSILVSGVPADSPPDRDQYGKLIKSEKCWLVVYLGTGHSDPLKWKFKSCQISGKKIELAYESFEPTDEPIGFNPGGVQFFYWAPLAVIAKGIYELRLVEAKNKQPRLIRYVNFP